MEPMALGSPVGSPAGTPSTPTTSPFLPSFLMGDTPTVSTPRSSAQARQQTPKHVTFSASSLAMPPSHVNTLPPQIGNIRALQSVTSSAEKSSSDFGPPTLGLFDTLSPHQSTIISSHNNSATCLSQSAMCSDVLSPSQATSITSPGSLSIGQGASQLTQEALLFGSEGQKMQGAYGKGKGSSSWGGSAASVGEGEPGKEADTWVTVFGFLPQTVNDILAHFVHCGTILEHRWGSDMVTEGGSSANKCNWIHLRFRTVREARRALGKNGKVFGGCMMVGVMPCQDVEILHNQKENVIQGPEVNFPSQQRSSNGSLSGIRPLGVDFTSPWKESPKTRSSNGSLENVRIRPMIKTATSPQNELQSGGSSKNSGLISKTIDFLFGQ